MKKTKYLSIYKTCLISFSSAVVISCSNSFKLNKNTPSHYQKNQNIPICNELNQESINAVGLRYEELLQNEDRNKIKKVISELQAETIKGSYCESLVLWNLYFKETNLVLWDDIIYDRNKFIKKYADSNNPFCQAALGYMYYSGTEMEQNIPLAIEWFEKAAKQDDLFSCATLGYLYSIGEHVNTDNLKAYQYFAKSAQLDDPLSLFFLGQCYEEGITVSKNAKQSLVYYQRCYDNLNKNKANHILVQPRTANQFAYSMLASMCKEKINLTD